MGTLYDTTAWREYRSRVLADDAECAFARIDADNCEGILHVHHISPINEGGPLFPDENGVAILCAAHHGMLHGWKRRKKPQWKRCPHHHVTPEGRRQCERRLNRVAA